MKQVFRMGAALLLSVAALSACGGPRAVRGEEVAGLDDQAMGTGLDKRDLQKLLHESLTALDASAVVKRWQQESQPRLAILPIRNQTSEHIESALDSLSSDIETQLVNAGHIRLVSREMQDQLADEVRKQQSDAYAPGQIANWGKMAGARYFVTGKVFSSDEMMGGERRVQYSLFIQVLDVETSDVLFQHKANLTKAILR